MLPYPYSTRELVNIVKHLQMFPNDSIQNLIRNVFDFDAFSKDTLEILYEVFNKNGVKLGNLNSYEICYYFYLI